MLDNKEKIYDTAIVGCGPAGLSAAINLKIRNMEFIMLGVEFCTPKLYKAENVDNYLGFYNISGEELRATFLEHARKMGIEIQNKKIDNIYFQGDYFTLISRNIEFKAHSVIIAVGVSNEKYLPGEEKLLGSGVSYCATCDGALYRGRNVAVVSFTEDGVEEAEYLSELAENVFFIPQYEFNGKFLVNNIKVINKKVQKINGELRVESLTLENSELDIDGVFVLRELTPPDKLLFGLEVDNKHIKVNEQMETNIPGVFAAGDCTGLPYQLARAVGQGQVAGLKVANFVRKKKKLITKTT